MSVRAAFRRFTGLEGTTDYIVLCTEGVHVVPHAVVSVEAFNKGLAMQYRDGADQLDVVYVPHNFRYLQRNGKYYLGKRVGNNSACAVLGPSLDEKCPGADLSALVRAHGVALGFRALYERVIPWKLIIIIGIGVAVIIGIVAFVGPRLFNG